MAAEPPEIHRQTATAEAETGIEILSSLQDWQAALARPALLVLWGGAHCGVCSALKPRIADLLQQTPALAGLALTTVDCEQAPAVLAGQVAVPGATAATVETEVRVQLAGFQ